MSSTSSLSNHPIETNTRPENVGENPMSEKPDVSDRVDKLEEMDEAPGSDDVISTYGETSGFAEAARESRDTNPSEDVYTVYTNHTE